MRRRFVLFTVLGLVTSGAAHAAVVVPADLSELAGEARAIVHGRVVATSAQWADGRRSIETLVTLQVEDTLKGRQAHEVTFRVPGGQLGPYRSIMLGAPTFEHGDEVVVFLGSHGPSIPHVLGFSQGVYRVSADSAGARRVVSGAALAPRDAPERQVRGVSGRQSPELALFLDQVRALVREGANR